MTGRTEKRYLFIHLGVFNQVMGILLDLLKIAFVLVIILLAVTLIVHLLPLLILIAAVLLGIWFLFYRNRSH